MTDTLPMFDPQPAASTGRQRDRTGAAHRCPSCGARTYRRIRRFPTLRTVDANCQRCARHHPEPITMAAAASAMIPGMHPSAVVQRDQLIRSWLGEG